MSVIALQQFYADEVLRMIERIDPFAIIAGGAPRDWYLGREATDLDVYFHPNPNWSKKVLKWQLENVGFDVDGGINYLDFQEHCNGYTKNNCIEHLYNPANTPMKIQLMAMTEPTFNSVLPSFPLNICMGWYKNKQLIAESALERAVRDKTLVRVNYEYDNDHPYIKKICAKFPDYDYVSCPQLTLTPTEQEDARSGAGCLDLLFPEFADEVKDNE